MIVQTPLAAPSPAPLDPALKRRIEEAVTSGIGACPGRIVPLPGGLENDVYRIETMNDPVVLKVFRRPVPEKSLYKVVRLAGALARHGIAHPEILFISNDDDHFPHGYLISSFVSGTRAREAVLGGAVTFDVYAERLGRCLRRVHDALPHDEGPAGPAQTPITYCQSWLDLAGHEMDIVAPAARRRAALLLDRVRRAVQDGADALNAISEVQVHGDPRAENVLLQGDERAPVLVDWDNAHFAPWAFELAHLMVDEGVYEGWGPSSPQRGALLWRGFVRGYGDVTSEDLLREAERLLRSSLGLFGLSKLPQDDGGSAAIRACVRLERALDGDPEP
jgi:Ser/Thr protein kinase RdoA (MazF antagonist)